MIQLLGGRRQVPGSPISCHYSLESHVGVSCCSALQAEAAPASLSPIVLGSGGRMSLAKSSLARKCHETSSSFPGCWAVAKAKQNNVWERICQVYPAGQGSAGAGHGWPDLIPQNVKHLWRELSRTRTRMSAEKRLLLRLGQGKICARLQCWNS